MLLRTTEYVKRGESFAIAIGTALERSFFTKLIYVCLNNRERSIQRVRERVVQGGHDVPDSDIRRRYTRSLANASEVLRIVHQGQVFDNSGAEPRAVFEMRAGRVHTVAAEIPAWAEKLLEAVTGPVP